MSTSSQGALVPPIQSIPHYNPRSFRIAQLLQANETPSPQELSELRRTVAEAPQNIINLGQRIEATRELLDVLITQQSYASDALDDARFITHSPRRLPEDVLLEIFYHCVNEVVEALRAGETRCVLHHDAAPLSLSQVCQSWRRVTIQAPLLWRCVSVNLHNHYVTREHHPGAPCTNHDDPRSSYLLCIHLQRARQVSLHVCINGRSNFAQIPLIPPLLSTSSAWVELSLRLPFSAYHQLATCHGFLDRLQFLRLSVKDHANVNAIIAPTEVVSVFSIAPQLREVRCDNLHNARNFFVFPPDGVERFSSRVDSKEDLTSLTPLPNVKDLSLHCYVDSFPQDLYAQWTAQGPSLIRPNAYRTLDSVTSLHMHQHVNGPQALARLYSALNLPSLSYLHFHFENYAQGYDLPVVSDSNRHTVTTLELTGRLEIEQGIHSIYDFLRSFPNLRRLILRIKEVPASLCVLLTYHATAESL
ncbi:hypothetical protein EDD85DRAFT_439197 [Armillaria nabsnona]|nr:hypothetical protein EDD85DRAFT_439197 [Armillaria nabsnona]